MKGYLLDTSLVAAFLHGRPNILTLLEPLVKNRQAGTSILVYGEVIEYLKGLPAFLEYKARLQKLFALNQITPYPLTYPSVELWFRIAPLLRHERSLLGSIFNLRSYLQDCVLS